MSGPTGLDAELLHLIGQLVSMPERASTATAIAERFGADSLMIFVRDPEIGVLLPAPGFPQTLPGAGAWRSFLMACLESGKSGAGEGIHTGTLRLGAEAEPHPAVALTAGENIVAVLVGGTAAIEPLTGFQLLLPILAAVFHSEQTAAAATAQAHVARDATAQATALSRTLNATRGVLQEALFRAESARAELKDANVQLEEQAAELEQQMEQAQMLAVALEESNARLAAAVERAESASARLSRVFAQAPAAIAILDGPEHVFLEANPLYRQLVGNRDIMDKPVRTALPEFEGQGIYDILDSVYATGTPFIGTELRMMIDRQGQGVFEEAFFDLVYQPLVDPAGSVYGIAVVATDVTAGVSARKGLVQRERQFRTLADTIPQLAWLANSEGWISWYNQRWYEYTGTSPEQVEGWGWNSVHDPEDLPRVLERWQAALRTNEPWEDTFRLRRHDGSYRWFLSRALPIENDEGRVVRWFGTNTDVTTVMEARGEAERANAAKSDFLASMSHELRTPLNAIGGYTDLIEMGLRGPVTPEQLTDLARIKKSHKYLLGLINDVLNFAKLGAGRVEYHTADVPVDATLRDTEEMIAPQFRDKEIDYSYEPCRPELTVRADREKVQQIVLNLIGNSMKFTPAGGSVQVSCDADEDAARIHVRDTGMGIPASKLATIFDPFVQVDRRFSQPSEGVGLGLAISRDLARGMGGDLAAKSEVGHGSTFTLTLPRH